MNVTADHLGSTRAEVHATDGLLSSQTTTNYWPFGEAWLTGTLDEKHLFTAHERDSIGTQANADPLSGMDRHG